MNVFGSRPLSSVWMTDASIGVTADGTKEWVAISDGLRESTESWLDVLRDYAQAAAVGVEDVFSDPRRFEMITLT